MNDKMNETYVDYSWDNITCDIQPTTVSLTDKDIVVASIFTKYPDLESKAVREGLGVDVVQGLRKIINESE